MADSTTFHIIRRRDLKTASGDSQWDDPDAIASLSPSSLKAYLESPFAGDDDEPVQVIATQANRVVGRIDMLPSRIRVGDQSVKIMWGSNLYVPPDSRNTLTGVILILKAQGLHHTVGAFGPSQAALPIYQKLKWSDRPIPRRILILRSRSVIEKYVGAGIHSKVIVAILDTMAATFRGFFTRPWTAMHTRGLSAQKSELMPVDLDPFLQAPTPGASMERSAGSINWWLTHAFKDDPRNANDLFLVRNNTDRVVAYFINKVRFHPSATHRGFKNLLLGSLQDWRIFDEHAIDLAGIIMLATRELSRRRVDAVEICTDDPRVRTLLKLFGFIGVGATHLLVKCSAASPLSQADLSDISKWSIYPGDGDNFFV